MYIGEASKQSGATVKAIRLYEELGLLSNVARENAYRVFTEEHVQLIKFIKVAQTFDIKLLELKDIIYPKGISDGSGISSSSTNLANWENIVKAIAIKEEKISKEIIKLQRHKKDLNNYKNEIQQCLLEFSDCSFPQVKQ